MLDEFPSHRLASLQIGSPENFGFPEIFKVLTGGI